jgi:ABC-2 type transport system permease protein
MIQRLRTLLNRTGVMAYKELLHIRRDPQVLAFALLVPIGLLLLFGYAITFDLDHVPVAVMDKDRTPESRLLEHRLVAGGLFEVMARPETAGEAEALFRNGTTRGTLVIPKGFSRSLFRNEPSTVQLMVDGADNNTASVSIGYAGAIISAMQPNARGLVDVRTRALFNPRLKSAIFIVPGLIALIPALVAVMMTALTVAREFERGSMEQLFATPVRRIEIVLGKLAPYLGLGLLQVALVVTVGIFVFGIPVEGSMVLLFAITTLFLLAVLMQGLVISVLTKNQVLASQGALISTLLPTLLLSGFIFPIENMPLPLRVLARILPPSHFMTAVRGIVLRGNGLEHLIWHAAAIFGFFLVMTFIAVARFQRTTN